jgi:anti-sigma factor ChrR (cupin superfamily)
VIQPTTAWPNDVFEPTDGLWDRLALRIATEADSEPLAAAPTADAPQWEEAAHGVFCKVLAADSGTDRVSMVVRLLPGIDYPPHEHADTEELHLLDGELWVNDRRLLGGDYHRAEAGSEDRRVWSETGCTCVLITSMRDRMTAGSGTETP